MTKIFLTADVKKGCYYNLACLCPYVSRLCHLNDQWTDSDVFFVRKRKPSRLFLATISEDLISRFKTTTAD